jgi:hypothetical protein
MDELTRRGIPYSVFVGTENGDAPEHDLTYLGVVPQPYDIHDGPDDILSRVAGAFPDDVQ